MFHIFDSQEKRRKYGGSAFMEIQFCRLPEGTPMEIFSQQSLVEDAFLRVPRTVELAQRLSQAGWSVDASCTDAKALGGQLCQLLQKN